ncbi:MAG TPA: cytochrome P460 family protein [Vicinamibacterales bacterium]|nr:cytochrome P460 family protein [Vicinamibacterales bacterium]
MNRRSVLTIGIAVVWLAVVGGLAISAQDRDKYAAKVPGGLAMSEFKGYESWQAVAISRNERVVAMILGNPVMIDAYKAGIPGNGQPFPDGAKMAKVHWIPKQSDFFKEVTVPGNLLNVDFMVKDSKRFADGGGWGYGVFDYDAESDTFKPGTTTGTPPQGNDARCGVACHTRAKARDYVFTDYGRR